MTDVEIELVIYRSRRYVRKESRRAVEHKGTLQKPVHGQENQFPRSYAGRPQKYSNDETHLLASSETTGRSKLN
jgi:hypothetical protein